MSAATKVDEKEYISTARAARICGVSTDTIRHWIDRGYIQKSDGYKPPGGHIRVAKQAIFSMIEKWKERQER